MIVQLMEDVQIAPALYGLGLSYGKTKPIPYKEFSKAVAYYEEYKEYIDKEMPNTPLVNKNDLIVVKDMFVRAELNAPLNEGHNKFLESINVHMLVTAPRMFWQEFDTYRLGMTKQSDSTMHTLIKDSKCILGSLDSELSAECKSELNSLDLENASIAHSLIHDCFSMYADACDTIRDLKMPQTLKKQYMKLGLPEAFPNTRQIATNYKTLRGLYHQRKNHELPQWTSYLIPFIKSLPHSEWITSKLDDSLV